MMATTIMMMKARDEGTVTAIIYWGEGGD